MRIKKTGVMAITVFAASCAAAWPRPQEKPVTAQQEKSPEGAPEKPAVLSSAALRAGAELEGAAAPSFLKWARDFAKKEIVKAKTLPAKDVAAKALAASHPDASAQARAAGEIVVWYRAYQEAAKAQGISGQRVRDVDKDLKDMAQDLRQVETTPVEISQLPLKREAEDRILARMQAAARMREAYARVDQLNGERVDFCMSTLAALTENAKALNPAEIRGLK